MLERPHKYPMNMYIKPWSPYLEGILIGYVSNVTPDTNNMTMTARITPAVDFSKLDTVLVITQLKNTDEMEEMTTYD